MSEASSAMSDKGQLILALTEFADTCKELHTLYLDSTAGFGRNHEYAIQNLESGTDGAESYVVIAPDAINADKLILHQSTLEQFKRRNSINNGNYVKSGQFLIVTIYSYWEHEYRGRVAHSIGVNPNNIKIPIMGDIRLLRNDILHHKGVLTSDSCKKLQHFKKEPGDEINLLFADTHLIFTRILESLDLFYLNHFDDDDLNLSIPTYLR